MAYRDMSYLFMAPSSHDLYSYGLYSYGPRSMLERDESMEIVRLTLVLDLPKSKIGVLRQKKRI